MRDVFVYEALRTPRAKAKEGGTLSAVHPADLLDQLYGEVETRRPGSLALVERLILGCVGQVGAQGGHLALVSKNRSGLNPETAVATVNNFCVSGLSAIGQAAMEIAGGAFDLALAGGVESMSQVPFLADRAVHYQDPALANRMRFVPPVVSADLLATWHGIGKTELDDETARSHRKAAQETGPAAASMVAVRDPSGAVILDRNEYVRPDSTAGKLAALEPAFGRMNAFYGLVAADARGGAAEIDARHSVANCPGVSDGAGIALLGTREAGDRLGLAPKAKWIAHAERGGDAIDGLTAGFAAQDAALTRAGLHPKDIGLYEAMEAFAVVSVLYRRRSDGIDDATINPRGGHLAKGHPMGATGAILLSCLLDGMTADDAEHGLVTAAGGSGVGSAAILQRA